MVDNTLRTLFGLQDRVAIVTGGTGILGEAMARGLAQVGARVGVLGRRMQRATEIVEEIAAQGGQAMALQADVLNRDQLEAARNQVVQRWGRIDILVNAAGGNVPGAIVGEQDNFFDMPQEAFEEVVDLNLVGTVLPSQVFGAVMCSRSAHGQNVHSRGCIVNISSATAQRAPTRIAGYASAKAAIDNFTRWLAIELARKYGQEVRVNAIAPGYFVTEQNRTLMTNPDGTLTERGRAVIAHTPMGRFGEPDDLISTLIWLCGDGARFVTGAVIPVDGAFTAYNGV